MSHFVYDIFLSFASLNEGIARTLYNQLCRSGLRVFLSDEELKRKPGVAWSEVIEESLEQSKHMVLLWTDEAMQSHWVKKEYRAFDNAIVGQEDRLLVPVLGNGKGIEALPLFLRQRQTYHLNGELEPLITSLGGRYIPVEQENERLKQELAETKKENQLLRAQSGKAKQADLERLRSERDEWRQKYAALENKALDASTSLNLAIEQKDKQIAALEKRIAALEKEPAPQKPKRKPSVKSPAKTLTDEHGIEFVLIEPGTFMMGDEKWSYTRPVHKVELTRPYYLGRYPVTQAQWKDLMGKEPSRFKGKMNPVESVSWNDVQECLKKLNSGESTYQLPTSAEWEYACRAGTATAYSFGADEKKLDEYAWYGSNSGNSTHPVGEKQPNRWGLYDMHGNVWEWVQDRYDSSYYEQFQNQTAIDPMGPDEGPYRVIRGGSWYNGTGSLRSANRGSDAPGNASSNLGFRLLRTLP